MAQSQTIAGHPVAMKVGGRRLSVSKSPKTTSSYLSTSPSATATATKDAPAATDTEKATATGTDDYPRPDNAAAGNEDNKDKEKRKEDKDSKGKDKQAFDTVKQKIHNTNPQVGSNHTIKQPAGKA